MPQPLCCPPAVKRNSCFLQHTSMQTGIYSTTCGMVRLLTLWFVFWRYDSIANAMIRLLTYDSIAAAMIRLLTYDSFSNAMIRFLTLWFDCWRYDSIADAMIRFLTLWFDCWRMIRFLTLWFACWRYNSIDDARFDGRGKKQQVFTRFWIYQFIECEIRKIWFIGLDY